MRMAIDVVNGNRSRRTKSAEFCFVAGISKIAVNAAMTAFTRCRRLTERPKKGVSGEYSIITAPPAPQDGQNGPIPLNLRAGMVSSPLTVGC
jgi:hypothetical protein